MSSSLEGRLCARHLVGTGHLVRGPVEERADRIEVLAVRGLAGQQRAMHRGIAGRLDRNLNCCDFRCENRTGGVNRQGFMRFFINPGKYAMSLNIAGERLFKGV
ncbi:hypothetical protein C8K63_12523 [Pseudomonas sp. GV085]|nr:hypothetical protein C8K63_12523 [Pseudomonas sp. GV085]